VARIIVDYPDDMATHYALRLAAQITEYGRISTAGDVPHFCWVANVGKPPRFTVITRRKKRGQTTDSLIITRVKEPL
jgi:hypothetical protein